MNGYWRTVRETWKILGKGRAGEGTVMDHRTIQAYMLYAMDNGKVPEVMGVNLVLRSALSCLFLPSLYVIEGRNTLHYTNKLIHRW